MKYQKPEQFSDPYFDWEGYEDRFREILAKQDSDLTTEDYTIIFARNLPAADYMEGAYYIDKCIAHIATGKEIHTSRFPDGFLWWLIHFKKQLEQDQLYEQIKESVMSALWNNLGRFELFDLTEAECQSLGRCFTYSMGPYNSSTVSDIIDELTIYDEFQPELEKFINDLIVSDRMEHVRWYVEMAFHTRGWCTTHNTEDFGLDNHSRKEALFHKLHSFTILQRKYERAGIATAQENKFKYNRLVSL